MTATEALIVLFSPAGFLPLVTVATMTVAAIDHWRKASR